MKNKILKNLLETNKNTNNLQNKNVNTQIYNSNKNELSSSRIIENSGWYNIKAYCPSETDKSSDGLLNNVIIAPYSFLFENVNISESQLKDLDFIIETKTNSNVTTKALKQWSASTYALTSDGYKVYSPSLVWQGAFPGVVTDANLPDTTILYKGKACRISYISSSSNLRQIYWNTIETIDTVIITDNYTMTRFDSLDDTGATGYGFHTKKSFNYPDFGTITYESNFGSLTCNYIDDDVDFKAGDDIWNSVSLSDMNNVYETGNWQAYYNSEYYWPIIYSFSSRKLIYLPETITGPYPVYPTNPSNLKLTIGENASIESVESISSSGITATGQSFFYIKKENGNHDVRIVGGIVYETNKIVPDDTVYNIKEQKYILNDDSKWEYDSVEIIDTLETPYYKPLEQDVQLRCLLNYNPLIKYKDFENK